MDLLIEFAKIDLGIACVIKNFVRDELAEGRLVQLKMPVSIPARKIGFAYAKSGAIPPTVRKLLSFCKNWKSKKQYKTDQTDKQGDKLRRGKLPDVSPDQVAPEVFQDKSADAIKDQITARHLPVCLSFFDSASSTKQFAKSSTLEIICVGKSATSFGA